MLDTICGILALALICISLVFFTFFTKEISECLKAKADEIRARAMLLRAKGDIEAIDFIDAFGLNINLRSVIKYIIRAGHKDREDTLTALQLAQCFLNREIQRAMEEAECPF